MINKLRLLRIVLLLGALYYLIGGFAHFFGLTLFPFFDAKLYAPYHDSIIALAAVIFAFFLLAIAKDPIKNIDTLKIVIIGEIVASIFSIAIIWKVDFVSLGVLAKEVQTIAEGIIGFIYVAILLWLYPKKQIKNL